MSIILRNNLKQYNTIKTKNSRQDRVAFKATLPLKTNVSFGSRKKAIELIERKTGDFVKATIEKSHISVSKYRREAFKIKKDNVNLGLLSYTNQDGYLKIEDLVAFKKDEFKKIGTFLIQAVVEESLKKGFDGKIKVLAQNFVSGAIAPFPFYMKKCGFTLDTKNLARPSLLKKAVEKEFERMEEAGVKYTRAFNCLNLELTAKNAKKWWAKTIKDNPLFISNT